MTHRSICRRRPWWLAGLGVSALVLAACGPENSQNSLKPKGPRAEQIDDLMTPVFIVAIIIGLLVLGFVVYMAIRFRHRPGGNDRPKQVHGNTRLEIGWTLVPAIILAVLAVPTVTTIFDLEAAPANAVEIDVIGKQWWWEFEYPAVGSAKAVVTANELHIPTDRDVALTLRSCDASLGETDGRPNCNVIHSFWVPELAGKRDVVPGRHNELTINADEPGVYLGQCAEYCGLSHANMRFRVIAQSPPDYEAWLEAQREGPAVALDDAGKASELFTAKFQCTNCHTSENSALSTYGPNLTHLASRTTFASGTYELTRANLVKWILDAPSLIPMESEDCRLPPPATCVGMPSFTKDTPKGMPVMSRAEAGALADYLLSLT